MMRWIGGFYVLEIIGVIVVVLLGYFIWDKRYKHRSTNTIPAGYKRTEEVNIDPVSGKKQRVYYNPETGERVYIDEKD